MKRLPKFQSLRLYWFSQYGRNPDGIPRYSSFVLILFGWSTCVNHCLEAKNRNISLIQFETLLYSPYTTGRNASFWDSIRHNPYELSVHQLFKISRSSDSKYRIPEVATEPSLDTPELSKKTLMERKYEITTSKLLKGRCCEKMKAQNIRKSTSEIISKLYENKVRI